MHANDILIRTDGFLCFREDLHPNSCRDKGYRELPFYSDEWRKVYMDTKPLYIRESQA